MLDLSIFQNPFPNVYIFEKWNWDYLDAEAFQLQCVEFVQQNPQISIFIFCSHPHCFTMGRGLQKLKDAKFELKEFDRSQKTPFPIHDIKRGGGLTFHYPGQLVLYPIVSTTFHKIAVNDLMMKILELTKECLRTRLDFQETTVRKDLLGLWFENSFRQVKIASIGLAASRFVTYHGLALNLYRDPQMFDSLSTLHPCGLPGDIYRDIETLNCSDLEKNLRHTLVLDLIFGLFAILNQSIHQVSNTSL
jgi:lipoyl(octanoyl) transferase